MNVLRYDVKPEGLPEPGWFQRLVEEGVERDHLPGSEERVERDKLELALYLYTGTYPHRREWGKQKCCHPVRITHGSLR